MKMYNASVTRRIIRMLKDVLNEAPQEYHMYIIEMNLDQMKEDGKIDSFSNVTIGDNFAEVVITTCGQDKFIGVS